MRYISEFPFSLNPELLAQYKEKAARDKDEEADELEIAHRHEGGSYLKKRIKHLRKAAKRLRLEAERIRTDNQYYVDVSTGTDHSFN